MATVNANLKGGIHSVFGIRDSKVKHSNSIRDQVQPFSKANLTMECNDVNYKDCYNCTLANCNWNVDALKCEKKRVHKLPLNATKEEIENSQLLTLKEFMVSGQKC
jgi:hypothetical protein